MPFPDRITAIRKELKLSQEKFGELVGLSQRSIAAWEAGERTPSHAVLTDLADKLDVSVDYLLDRSDDRKIKEPASNDELRYRTYNKMINLPEPVLVRILDLIDAIQSSQASGSTSPAPRGSSDPGDP